MRNPSTKALLPLSILALLTACEGNAEEGQDDAESSSSEGGESSATAPTSTSPETGSGETAPATEGSSGESGTDPAESSSDGSESSSESGTETDTETGGEIEPLFALIDLSRPIDVTPDGRIALLEDPSQIDLEAFYYDIETGETTFAATIGDAGFDFSTGISDDLRISALHDVPVQAGVFRGEKSGWLDLASPFEVGCDDVAGAWDISADGTVVVGLAWDGCAATAFRWVDDGGAGTVTALDVIGTGNNGNAPTNRASVVSADGQVIAGFAQNTGAIDRAAAVWQADGTGILLAPDEEWPQEVLSISADGQMVAGTRGYDGFYWTEAAGMTSLGHPPEVEAPTNTFPNVIAADAGLIAGGFGDPWGFDVPVAFVWTEADGMRALQGIIEENGLDVPDGVLLTNTVAGSADGSVLMGTAMDAKGYQQTFVVRLAPAAYGL